MNLFGPYCDDCNSKNPVIYFNEYDKNYCIDCMKYNIPTSTRIIKNIPHQLTSAQLPREGVIPKEISVSFGDNITDCVRIIVKPVEIKPKRIYKTDQQKKQKKYEYSKKYHEKNDSEIKLYQKKYYQKHKKKLKLQSKLKYEKNKILNVKKSSRQQNLEKKIYLQGYYKENKETIGKRTKRQTFERVQKYNLKKYFKNTICPIINSNRYE